MEELLTFSEASFAANLRAGMESTVSGAMIISLESQAEKDVADKTDLTQELIQANDKDLRLRAAPLAAAVQSRLAGALKLDSSTPKVAGTSSPTLKLEGRVLNMDFSIPDEFTHPTEAIATVLAKTGDGFIPITTSAKPATRARAVEAPQPSTPRLPRPP